MAIGLQFGVQEQVYSVGSVSVPSLTIIGGERQPGLPVKRTTCNAHDGTLVDLSEGNDIRFRVAKPLAYFPPVTGRGRAKVSSLPKVSRHHAADASLMHPCMLTQRWCQANLSPDASHCRSLGVRRG